jgi:hypothetical protein
MEGLINQSSPQLEVRYSTNTGRGILAIEDIFKGEYVLEYKADLIYSRQICSRMNVIFSFTLEMKGPSMRQNMRST